MRRTVLLVLFLGCQRQTAPIQKDEARSVPSHSAPAPPAPPKPISRIKGPLAGGFSLNKTRYIALEPIFASLDAKNTDPGPISFDVGGDYRGSYLPIRYGVFVRDESGVKVCDIRATPPISFGGLGSARRLGPGESFRETFAINSVCEAITKPGRYIVTLVRRFSQQMFTDAGVSCDDMLATESIPPGTSAACAKFLDAAPIIATDLAFEVVAYDPKLLAAELDPYVVAAKSAKDIGDQYDRTLYFQWLCRHVTCSCGPGPAFTKASDLAPFMTSVIAKLPPTVPTKLRCP